MGRCSIRSVDHRARLPGHTSHYQYRRVVCAEAPPDGRGGTSVAHCDRSTLPYNAAFTQPRNRHIDECRRLQVESAGDVDHLPDGWLSQCAF
jgi:hypothetical protein